MGQHSFPRRRRAWQSPLACITAAALIAPACRDQAEPVASPPTFRDADPPPGLADDVDQLRETGVTIETSSEVGTIAGAGSVSPTGQAGYTIPIDVPPGAGGLVPSVALQYSSGGGNGFAGLGWTVSGYSTITRCPKTIADDGAFEPVALQPEDAVCLDGERLVLVSGSNLMAGAEYRTRRDPFARISFVGDFKGGHFKVEHRDGRISRYGTVAALEADGVGHTWLLDQIADRYGNTVDYEYDSVFENFELVGFRPTRIAWEGGSVKLIADPDGRADEARGFRFGTPFAHLTRLQTIEVYGGDDELLHTHHLEYDAELLTDRSILTSVQKCDAAGQCLPATSLAYWPGASDLFPPEEDLPGMPDGIRHLTQTQEENLRWTRRSLVGDFNGDLTHEVLTWDPELGIYKVWRTDYGEFGDGVIGLASPDLLPPSWAEIQHDLDADVRALAANAGEPPYSVEYEPASWDLHRVQPTIGYAVINLDNDRRDDVLAVVGGGRDAWGVGYGDQFRISTQGSDYEDDDVPGLTFNQVFLDDGSEDPIYNLVPADHDGNGLTDLWLCRGQGFKSAHWVLALNEGDSGFFDFSYHDSNVGCSIHDEINVLSTGRGDALFVIPAYEHDPDFMVYPGADPGEYLANVQPLPEDERTEYRELRFDPGTTAELVPTGLPRDLFQRWRDRGCHNSVADAQLSLPAFGAGLSLDRQLDINGDGLIDILRAELATDPPASPGGADTHANIDAIKNGLGPDDTWALGVTCSLSQALGGVVLRAWVNTGDGFVRGDVAYTFSGNPHANLWTNIVGGQMFDRNRDGLADLLVPSTGVGGGWTVLRGTGRAFDCPGGACFIADAEEFTSGWPQYTALSPLSNAWKQTIERASVVQMRAAGSGVVFEGAVDEAPDPPQREIAVMSGSSAFPIGSRLREVTNGLGAVESFTYGCAGDPDDLTTLASLPSSANRPTTAPRTCIPVVRGHSVPVGPQTGGAHSHRGTTYRYGGAVIGQHGRGFVGFETVESSYAQNFSPFEQVVTRAEYDLVYDETLRDYPRARTPARVQTTYTFRDSEYDTRIEVECRDIDSWDTVVLPELGGDTWFSYATTTHVYRDHVASETDCDDITPYYDVYGTEQRNARGVVTQVTTDVVDGESVTVTSSELLTDEANWFIDKPRRIETQSCRDGECRTRTAAIVYNPPVHKVLAVTREPDASDETYLQTEYDYEGHGRRRSVTLRDAGGQERETVVTWDATGRLPRSVTNAEGHVSYVVHHEPSGVAFASVDPNGVTSHTTVDGFFRPIEQTVRSSPTGAIDGTRIVTAYLAGPEPTFGAEGAAMRVRTTRFPSGQRVTVELAETGHEIRRRWKAAPDAKTFPVEFDTTSWSGGDIYVDTAYSPYGTPDAVTHPTRIPEDPEYYTATDYDVFGRPVERRVKPFGGPSASIERWGYDHGVAVDGHPGSVRVRHTDPDGHQSEELMGIDGRLALSEDAAGTLTCYDYGPFGVLQSVQRNCRSTAEGLAPTTVYTHDIVGRATSETDPAFGTTTTVFTAFGEPDVTTDAAGVVLDFNYDLLGRLISRDDHGEGVATWEWDTDHIGALFRSVSVDGFTRKYVHDEFGRISQTRLRGPTAADGTRARWASQNYSYAGDGRLREIEFDAQSRDPDFAVSLSYDEYGNLRSLHDATSGALFWGSEEIDAAGYIAVEQFGNGATTTRTYEPDLLRPALIATADADDVTLQELTYDWTPAGDLESRQDKSTSQLETFGYDDLHRLTSWTVGTNDQSATYDALGNITSKTGLGPYSYDTAGQLQSTTFGTEQYSYLANGNLESRGDIDLTWTPLDMVRSLTSGTGTLSYRYDSNGTRTFRTDGAEVRVTTSELFERRYDGALSEVRYRIPTADGRIAAQVVFTPSNCSGSDCTWSSATTYQHDDHLGSRAS